MGTRKYPKGTEKENQLKRQNEFIAEKYDRFTLTFPKGKKKCTKVMQKLTGKALMDTLTD